MYALSGAYAAVHAVDTDAVDTDAVDTDALNAQQSLVRFEHDRHDPHILRINSVENTSSLTLQLHKTSGSSSELAIFRNGGNRILAKVLVELAPYDGECNTCKVSVKSYNDALALQNYANASFFTKSNDLACMNLRKINLHKVFGISAAVECNLPENPSLTRYYLSVSMFLSKPEDITLSLTKCAAHLLDKPVFILTYDKGKVTPTKVLL